MILGWYHIMAITVIVFIVALLAVFVYLGFKGKETKDEPPEN